MIFFEVAILIGLLVGLEKWSLPYFSTRKTHHLTFLGLYFVVTVLIVRLIFEYSLYSFPTFLSLLPATFFLILQVVKLFHEVRHTRFSSILLIIALSFGVWFCIQVTEVRIHQIKFVEYVFTGKHIFKSRSIDPHAGETVKM